MSTSNVPAYLQKFMDNGGANDADSLASASTSVPRISLKGKKFQFINGDDESKKTDEIHVAILAVDPEGGRMIKTFYASGYNPADTAPPDCSSSNGIAPDSWVQSPVADSCANCPKNVFGSATSPTGKKTKACRDSKRLWVAKADDVGGTVYGLNVPVTSLREMADYGKQVRSVGAPLAAIVTRIYMDEDSEFPRLKFERVGFLNEENGTVALERNESRDWVVSSGDKKALPNNSKPAPKAIEKSSDDVIEGSVSSTDVDDITSEW